MITALINKRDNYEIIRDSIAAILTLESASQMALALAAGEDPDLWKLRVFSERSNPWEEYLNDEPDRSPIVNVWYNDSTFPERKGDVMERQGAEGTFNIDCYGYGKSADDGLTGHIPGDRAAAVVAQRTLRLVRNIIMSAEYTYLGLRGLVVQRWPMSTTVFQPESVKTDRVQQIQQVQQIIAARMELRVRFSEFSPQYEAEVIDLVSVVVTDLESGEVVINTDYDYT